MNNRTEKNHIWYEKNKDKVKERTRQWQSNHPGYSSKRSHELGLQRPISEATESAPYLGVYIAERALSRFFDNIIRMPVNNPGYDFLCGKGKKIDVKSSCLQSNHGIPSRRWRFNILKNTTADYFLCLAFNDRNNLDPLHVWLIPGNLVNDHISITVSNFPIGLNRFAEYERPLDKVIACCSELRR